MKKLTVVFILLPYVLIMSQLPAQNGVTPGPVIPYYQNRSLIFGNDVILNDQPFQNQRNVVVRSAFNGWLYAGYTYVNEQHQWPAAIILKSENNGLSWSLLIDMVQAYDNNEMTSLDFVVVGDSINNLKLLIIDFHGKQSTVYYE